MPENLLYGRLAPYYDRIYSGKGYRQETRELLSLARRALGRRPRSLLDVGCGTGRHLAEFGRTVRVAGVDGSAAMLREARQRLGASIPLRVGDMRTFRFRERFDVVTCLFSAIAYMDRREDRDRAIANFYRHLQPGGVALVEGWVRRSRWRRGHVSLDTFSGEDVRIARVAASRREGDRSVVEFQYLIGEVGRPIRHYREVHRNPLYEPEELLGSFRRAGFRARVLLGGRYRDRGLYVGVRPAG